MFRMVLVILMMALVSPTRAADANDSPTTPPPASAHVLKVRVSEFPPLYYRDASGNWTGLDVELARLLVTEAGYSPEFVERPWSRALRDLEHGDIHVMMNLSRTPERSAFVQWIGPERTAAMGLVVKTEHQTLPIHSLDDLVSVANTYQLPWGAQRDVAYSPEFNAKLADPAFASAFDFVADFGVSPKKLKAGRILGFFEDVATMRYQIRHHPDYQGLTLHPYTLAEEQVYFGFSKVGVPPDAFTRLQAAYTRLENSGAFDQIRQQEWN